MRKQVLWLALCAGLGLSACATSLRPQAPEAPVDASKACADWRWIGISRPGARCPDAPGWTVRPLFAQLAPVQEELECPADRPVDKAVPDSKVIRELNRFCVYEIEGSKKGLKKKLPFPPAAGADLVRVDRDCAALSLSEHYLQAKSWKPTSGDFLAQTGPGTPLKIENQRGVRLSILDTQPDDEGVPRYQGRSPHGYTLAKIAQELVCSREPGEEEPYGRCAAQVTTRLAMPIVKFDAAHPKDSLIDREWGGYLGMQSDLAEAIRNEVDDWLEKRTATSQRRLVLNLSMAWDGNLFGGLGNEEIADMQAGTQAVYRALQYAAGFDVLVLAAAGNQKEEPCKNFGPLLPAAWEITAPRETCFDKAPYPPLVYAVGGLNAYGDPLDNARPGGMPRRAAYGETDLFTGSSVATAVVSSIAAVIWDTFPGLSPRKIMNILDGTEENVRRMNVEAFRRDLMTLNADFWSDVPTLIETPRVRRLSLCTALARACVGRSSPLCDARPQCETSEHGVTEDLRVLPEGHVTRKPVNRGSCQPWLFPQPEIEPCPACIEPPPK